MLEECEHQELIRCKTRSTLIDLWYILKDWFKVTVLFILVVCPGPMRADDVNGIGLRLFEFTSEFYLPMGRGIFEGLMACDDYQYRIAIYWMEPAVYHDKTFFMGYSDFIFKKNEVHYWINGVSEPGKLDLSGKENVPLLPRDVSVKSVGRSVLAIVNRIRTQPQNGDKELELGSFFQQSRDRLEYLYEVPSEKRDNDQISSSHTSDEEILNNLPFGRKYSKRMQSDGTLEWRAQRVLDGPHVARVTVKPIPNTEADELTRVFETESLGQWTLIPEPYRAYWSFEMEYSKLKDLTDNCASSRELYEKIESYLNNKEIPSNVCLFLNRLWFKTALLRGDSACLSKSAKSIVSRLCEDDTISDYDVLTELGRIANEIREKYPQEADEVVRALMVKMVKHMGPDIEVSLKKFMSTIESKRWFWFGEILFEETRNHDYIEKDTVDALSERIEAVRLSREIVEYDLRESSDSVKQYMVQINSYPPKGTLTNDDVREILEKGLAKPCKDAKIEQTDELVDNVVRSIRMIAGEGPFRGDKDKLIKSIKQFSGVYLVVLKHREPIDTVLATFLALSFCDTSTPEDHNVLFSQISKICSEFQGLTNRMLDERGLSSMVEPNDVEKIFKMYIRIFLRNIDNPLWPSFKFPLTKNEIRRFRNELKVRFMNLEPVFEEMSFKVKYGGESKELKDKTIYKISLAAQQILPQAAFLRRPPYPGISCRYRGRYGFSAVIRGPFYIEGERPREKFKAMKYFHMGHRLEDIVKRERELSGFK